MSNDCDVYILITYRLFRIALHDAFYTNGKEGGVGGEFAGALFHSGTEIDTTT